jgi:polyphenol oxidase
VTTALLLSADWHAAPGVRMACSTRIGGVSAAPWHACNLGDHVGDLPQAVAANRRLLCAAAELPAEPQWLRQVHGSTVADLDARDRAALPTADASITSQVGTVCAVLTADCLPVLLAASDGSVVGAAHAGWRGLAAGVLENTVAVMRKRAGQGASLRAWLGPAISAAHFEVGAEVRTAFVASNARAESAFRPGAADRWYCDLNLLARQRLAALGVSDVAGGQHCTYADADRFYSHRRDVQHQRLASTGRMAALIWRT